MRGVDTLEPPLVCEWAQRSSSNGSGRVLQLRELTKHYRSQGGETVRAVDGVNLTLAPGQMLALYGPSGSGKSTLLLMVAALLAPTSGEVFVNGREITALREREACRYRLREVGFIGQSLELLPGLSALDNAALKLAKQMRFREARRRVTPLLQHLGLGDRLQQRAELLSTGERQRVMIARALSVQPSLILADEPTGSLDTHRSSEVLALLAQLAHERQVSVLLATHDPQAAAHADAALALRDGRLTAHEPERPYATASV